jgi:hypothetical protein
MAGRTRTTKKLAQRIDRNYFKNLFPIPRWRWYLSGALTALGILWLGTQALAHRHQIYSSGPLSPVHAIFAGNCAACHVQKAVFSKTVTDQACASCHDGPVHQAQQTFMPACAECHLEHKGLPFLVRTRDQSCTRCHADLKTRNGPSTVAARIDSFAPGHPEFAALRNRQPDPGTIKFNHQIHLKPELRGPRINVQMKCDDCHRTSAPDRPWPYGQAAEIKPVALPTPPAPHSRMSPRSLMQAVDYYRQCSSCHPLFFDKRINEPAPHKDAETVRAFVIAKLQAYIAAHPGDIGIPDETDGRIPPRVPPSPARNAAEWVQRRVAQAEQLLWGKTCQECHSLSFATPASAPQIQKANLTARWLTRGAFDHDAHRMVVCASCHTQAPTSKSSADVLLPGIKICQACHRSGTEAARADCSECHQYHDWKKEQYVEPRLPIAVRDPL